METKQKQYGELPTEVGVQEVDCKEMMFYQYLPIKLRGESYPQYEDRLNVFDPIITKIIVDFIREFGMIEFEDHYVYMTAKHQYQAPNKLFNREGYHSDGFLTDDINYIWSNRNPTVFNFGTFSITLDDNVSLQEMEAQTRPENEITYPDNTILRLDQYNIHKVNDNPIAGMRTFIKISFSKDRYDLEGNAHNYLLDYSWEMKQRKIERNIPQSILI